MEELERMMSERRRYKRKRGAWCQVSYEQTGIGPEGQPPWCRGCAWWHAMSKGGCRTVTAVHLCDTCAQTKCWTRRDIENACEDALFPARAVVVECKAYVANGRAEEAGTCE